MGTGDSAANRVKVPRGIDPSTWLPRRGNIWFWSLAALLLGLLVTAAGLRLQLQRDAAHRQVAMAQAAERVSETLQLHLWQGSVFVRALQGVFLSGSELTPQGFQAFVAEFRRDGNLPQLVAAGFARKARAMPQGPGYGYRYEMVAPLRGNESLLGFDVARQPENLRALLLARDLDTPVMSSPFRLRQPVADPADADGYVIRLPAFSPGPLPRSVEARHKREIGALVASFRLRPMLQAAVQGGDAQGFRVRIDDVTGTSPLLLYDSGGGAAEAGATRRLSFGQRQLQVAVAPASAGASLFDLWPTALAGGLASGLLALLTWSVLTTQRRALALGTQMSEQFRDSEERFRALNDLLPAFVLLARVEDGVITYANEAARQRFGAGICGAAGEEVRIASLFEEESLQKRLHGISDTGEQWHSVEGILETRAGDRFWASTSIARVELGGRLKLLMVATDISEQRQLTEMLSYQASHDALTELFNRREFERWIEHTLASVNAGGPPCALLYIDLDQFKVINDTSGHNAGDQLLSQLAMAMREQLRAGDVLARLGGDEFGVLIVNAREDSAVVLAERLRECIDGYIFVWETRSYTISASIGAVMIDRPNMKLKDVLALADTACYMAKEHGRNRVHFHVDGDGETNRRRGEMEWVSRLRDAVATERLLLDYQELHPLDERGAEVAPYIELLLRLRDENGRVVLPGAFLPAAERFGLMPMIDRWVVDTALGNFDRLHPSGKGLRRCSINLSGASLEDESMIDYILERFETHRVEPSRVCFEITETVAVSNLALVVKFIERLREHGCSIALDDFGAGMSSFGYLKNLPIDLIKIDGSFIRDLDVEPMSYAIVRAIADIGHQRGLQVAAEWVATASVVGKLRELGVDYAQGIAMHMPEPTMFQLGRLAPVEG